MVGVGVVVACIFTVDLMACHVGPHVTVRALTAPENLNTVNFKKIKLSGKGKTTVLLKHQGRDRRQLQRMQ